jgi:hypothetical protein
MRTAPSKIERDHHGVKIEACFELREEKLTMSVDGTWNITMQTPLGERQNTIVLQSDGAKLIANERLIYDGNVNGNEVAWKTDITNPMEMTLKYKGKVDGDAISGTVSSDYGDWSFNGTRA